ncbi:MAG TPA: KEOPS complex subunit [Candidatus Bathyarchaeota archaeon]|nr:KEOPS complex subunit [Candidatus Bathyarchaeota archaeon]
MEAKISLRYEDKRLAEAIANAVSPDNFKVPKGLQIKTTLKDEEVFTRIKCKGKIATFIATIDDLLFSVSTAEKTLKKPILNKI